MGIRDYSRLAEEPADELDPSADDYAPYVCSNCCDLSRHPLADDQFCCRECREAYIRWRGSDRVIPKSWALRGVGS